MSVLVRSALSLTLVALMSAGTVVLSAQKQLSASGAWVKVPAAGETMAMAFVEIANPTMYDVFFTSGTSNAAGKVELRDKSKGADPKAQATSAISHQGGTLVRPKVLVSRSWTDCATKM